MSLPKTTSSQNNFGRALLSGIAFNIALIFCMVFNTGLVLAQDQPARGKVEVIKDPRIDSFALRRVALHKAGGTSASTAATGFGYRVQLFNGSNRKEAFDTQARFQERYPETHTYITYREPNFKLRIGDFRSRLEATKMMEELKPGFSGMFIISETVNYPKTETTITPPSNE